MLSYLDGFWLGEKNKALPKELHHNLRLVRELDKKTNALMKHHMGREFASCCELHGNFVSGCKAEQERQRRLQRRRAHQQDRMRSQSRRAASSKRKAASFGTFAARKAVFDSSCCSKEHADLCIAACNAKIDLAKQTYELLDNHIRRLDRVLKRFDSEIELEEERLGGHKAVSLDIFGLQCDDSAGEFSGYCPGRTSGYGGLVYDQTVDANEPVYCFCRQVAFGEMICCDNQDCRIEWFHFACVGLTPETRPTSRWLCPDCAARERKGLSSGPCF